MRKRKVEKNKPFGVIYMYRNEINQKKYVGQTIDLHKRMLQHKKGYFFKNGQCSLLTQALNKYKEENFDISVLRECASKDEMDFWETFYIKEYNCLEHGYNIMAGKYCPEGVPKSVREKLRKTSQGKKWGFKAKYLCVYKTTQYDVYGSFVLQMTINKKSYSKYFRSEIEAAETYDKIVLHLYGLDAVLNFPEKKNEYLKENLQVIYASLINNKKRVPKFKWVILDARKRWCVFVKCILNKPRPVYPGTFDSEEEAAKIADKFMFLYDNIPIEELNFPDLAQDFDKEKLRKSLYKYFYEYKTSINSKSIRGIINLGKTWGTVFSIRGTYKTLTVQNKTKIEALSGLKDYLEEFQQDIPDINNLKHLCFGRDGAFLLKNKNSFGDDFIAKMERFYDSTFQTFLKLRPEPIENQTKCLLKNI
jgi:group I intron endonuclease